jgi:hypothetical protein
VPSTALSERAAHFPPHQAAAHLAYHSAEEVWQYGVDHDASGRLTQYKPREELANAQLTCQFVIPSDGVWPAALAEELLNAAVELLAVGPGASGWRALRRRPEGRAHRLPPKLNKPKSPSRPGK